MSVYNKICQLHYCSFASCFTFASAYSMTKIKGILDFIAKTKGWAKPLHKALIQTCWITEIETILQITEVLISDFLV